MGADAVGEGLDEGRALAAHGLLHGATGRDDDGEDVVAVHLDALEAVGIRLHGEVGAGRLDRGGR
ncbi:hypothetical protein D3C87_1750920 [compost metagenome]